MKIIKTAIQCESPSGKRGSFLYILVERKRVQCSPVFSSCPELFKWAKEKGFRDNRYDHTFYGPLYHLVAHNLNTGTLTPLTEYVMPYDDCMTMKSKMTQHKDIAIMLVDIKQ